MISICAVTLDSIRHYEDIFLESILEKTTLVSEVILAKNDADESHYKEWERRGIKFKEFGASDRIFQIFGETCGHQHALGLHFAISKATNNIVYLCDPDIFFYSAVDEFFYNVMQKYKLDAIGCSHHAASGLCSTFFPWHGNIIMMKDKLPDKEWLKPQLLQLGHEIYPLENKTLTTRKLLEGKFLLPPLGIDYKSLYPNPNGHWDTASALWLYAHQQNWKWLAFQTISVHTYNTLYYRSNLKINEKFGKNKLIHHAVSGSIEKKAWNPYKIAYQNRENND